LFFICIPSVAMASAGEADIEALKKEREEKVRQIAEKRRQVEELKARRAKRGADKSKEGAQRNSLDINKSVDDLLADMLASGADVTMPSASPDKPLHELARSRSALKKDSRILQNDRVAIVAMEPHLGDVYDKGIQTDLPPEEEKKDPVVSTNVLSKIKNLAKPKKSEDARVSPAAGGNLTDGRRPSNFDAPPPEEPKELSAEEKTKILASADFQSFFKRTSLLVERTLGQDAFDVAVDFSADQHSDGVDAADQFKPSDDYIEERWCTGRPITDVRFSPHRKELFLAAYGQKTNPSLSDPDGCALVWNLSMQKRPEVVFTCQSAVLTSHFHRFNPAIFFGGTYSGGVVLWDARAKAGPVQRTPLSAKGHSHPVQAMQQVGTQNATNLVTASNDGRLCVWSLAMLVHPQESIDLKNEKSSNRRDLAVMSLSFPENETNILYVGAEDGSVCQVHIHGAKVGVTEAYDGHDGPVTSIDLHPHGDASQYGVEGVADLALSSSFDWSVKLWMVKQSQSPMLLLDLFEDYVYDVRWHPTHPAIFSTVDGEGHVDLWNLNKDLESPIVRYERPCPPGQQRLALNRCYWSSDGKRLATGDSEGTLSMYKLDKSLAQPRNDDFTMFQERVRSFQPIVSRSREAGFGLDSKFGSAPSHGYGRGLDSSGRF